MHLTPEEDARLRELETPLRSGAGPRPSAWPPRAGPHHPPPRPQAVARKGN